MMLVKLDMNFFHRVTSHSSGDMRICVRYLRSVRSFNFVGNYAV